MAGCARPQQSRRTPQQFSVESFRWSSPIDSGQVVQVINHYGNIRFRSSDDGLLEISAMIQKLDPQAGDVHVNTHEHADGAIIRVGPPSTPSTPAGWFHGRVDVTVLVPPGVSISAHTLEGLIEIKGVTGDVVATSIGGDIHAVRPRHIQATTRRGQINVELAQIDQDRLLSLESVESDIAVRIAENSSLSIQARTTGALIASFSEKTASAVQKNNGTLQATLRDGGSMLNVESQTGNIEIVSIQR
ncbi:MAG: hypothetical protein ACE5GE_12545 [Phycisphaerae bacterium]